MVAVKEKISDEMLLRLNADQVFRQRFRSDDVLKKLWTDRGLDEGDRQAEFMTAIGASCSIKGKPLPQGRLARFLRRKPKTPQVLFEAPCPGVIALLAHMESPYVKGGKVRPVDIDIALRTLILKRETFAELTEKLKTDMELASAGLCARLGVDYEVAHGALSQVFRLAFAAYGMMPESAVKGLQDPCRFDADWLAGIVADISAVSRLSPDEIIWNLPMCLCGYYIMNGYRRQGVKNIRRKIPGDAFIDRMDELMEQRVKEFNDMDVKS